MASFKGVEIKRELRPCLVGGAPALFHMWEERSEIIEPSIMVGGHGGGVVKGVNGIVETEDGRVVKVHPTSITFVDQKIKEYCFKPEDNNEKEVVEAKAKIITSKYTCADCSERCSCIVDDSQLDCVYFAERYEWVMNILTGGSSQEG